MGAIHANYNSGAWERFKENLKRDCFHAGNKFAAKEEFDIRVEKGDTRGEVAERIAVGCDGIWRGWLG